MLYGRIVGWGKAVPDQVLTNFDLERWSILQTNGLSRAREFASGALRRRASTPRPWRCRPAKAALEKAGSDCGRSRSDHRGVVFARSFCCPPVSSQIQHQLGANCGAFTLVAGCTGFVYALVTAQQFIAAGAYRTILVIGAEVISRNVDWTDRNTCVLFRRRRGRSGGAGERRADRRVIL